MVASPLHPASTPRKDGRIYASLNFIRPPFIPSVVIFIDKIIMDNFYLQYETKKGGAAPDAS